MQQPLPLKGAFEALGACVWPPSLSKISKEEVEASRIKITQVQGCTNYVDSNLSLPITCMSRSSILHQAPLHVCHPFPLHGCSTLCLVTAPVIPAVVAVAAAATAAACLACAGVLGCELLRCLNWSRIVCSSCSSVILSAWGGGGTGGAGGAPWPEWSLWPEVITLLLKTNTSILYTTVSEPPTREINK